MSKFEIAKNIQHNESYNSSENEEQQPQTSNTIKFLWCFVDIWSKLPLNIGNKSN